MEVEKHNRKQEEIRNFPWKWLALKNAPVNEHNKTLAVQREERERERGKKRVAFLFGDTSRVSRFVRRRRRRFSFAGAVSNPKKGKYEKSSPAREREREAANFPERSSTGTNLIAIQLLTPESLMLIEKNKRRYSRF